MKKKAERTMPVAGRVDCFTDAQLRKGAAGLEMSMSQYVSYLLTTTLFGTDTHVLQERLVEVTSKLEDLQQQAREEREAVWEQEPFVTLLQKVLHNEGVLEELHAAYGAEPIPVQLMRDRGYHAGFFLSGEKVDGKVYHCTGRFAWSYADRGKTLVTILKRS
ncbi:hypothetical protein ACSX1A_09815 [Pontibacter sp. MBLB2868]|uniref:hypothetical protein n=1 Tax=Pontibacter sp. MBLB2868 TaxID=3451555 RepID=UPI003F755F35